MPSLSIMFNSATFKSACAYTLKLLVRREYCIHELQQKLATKYPYEVIEAVIADFIERNYINEQRYVDMIVRHYAGRGYGVRKIKYELTQKHVSLTLLDTYLQEHPCAWEEVACKQLQARYHTGQGWEYQDKQKALAFLLRRGFSTNEAISSLRRFLSLDKT